MLHGVLPEEVQVLQESKIDFFLTGSRFFGGYTESSDWDFFTQYKEETVDFLGGQGFYKSQSYIDSQTTLVMTLDCASIKIDVQLVDSVQLKQDAQNLLIPYLHIFSKDQRRCLWDLVFKALKSNR